MPKNNFLSENVIFFALYLKFNSPAPNYAEIPFSPELSSKKGDININPIYLK